MSDAIQTTYAGVVVTLNEHSNRWHFELRGRDRSADTLPAAREIIDKPAPKTAKPFAKIPAWEISYNSEDPVRVDITSVAEPSRRGNLQVWINREGQRRKEEAERRIYPSNPFNDSIITDMLGIKKEIKKLANGYDEIRGKLQPLVIAEEAP